MNSLHDQVAKETLEGHVIYPDRLPKTRGPHAELTASVILVIIILAAALVNMGYSESLLTFFQSQDSTSLYDSVFHIVHFGAFYIVTAFVAELIMRICYLLEEKDHLRGRYDGNWGLLLVDLFSMRRSTLITAALSLSIIVAYCIKNGSLPWNRNPIIQPMMFIGAYIFSKLLKLDQSELMDNIQMERMEPLDYGSGMALNFFYGYLNIVLPSRGDSEKGLKERIRDYMDIQGLTEEEFPVKKLFILIPASTWVPPTLEEVSFGWMEAAQSLEKQVKDRAGVIGRPYKNSVYKIQDPNGNTRPIYVVAEGATPLKTFHEAIQYSGEKQDFLKKHQKQIVLSFYEQLRKIFRNDRDCCDLCELVYFLDLDDKGKANVNVARKILDRIEEIKQKEAVLQSQRGEGS